MAWHLHTIEDQYVYIRIENCYGCLDLTFIFLSRLILVHSHIFRHSLQNVTLALVIPMLGSSLLRMRCDSVMPRYVNFSTARNVWLLPVLRGLTLSEAFLIHACASPLSCSNSPKMKKIVHVLCILDSNLAFKEQLSEIRSSRTFTYCTFISVCSLIRLTSTKPSCT